MDNGAGSLVVPNLPFQPTGPACTYSFWARHMDTTYWYVRVDNLSKKLNIEPSSSRVEKILCFYVGVKRNTFLDTSICSE